MNFSSPHAHALLLAHEPGQVANHFRAAGLEPGPKSQALVDASYDELVGLDLVAAHEDIRVVCYPGAPPRPACELTPRGIKVRETLLGPPA